MFHLEQEETFPEILNDVLPTVALKLTNLSIFEIIWCGITSKSSVELCNILLIHFLLPPPLNYYFSCNLILLTFSWPMTRSLEHLLETARSRQQQQNSRSGLQKLRTFDHGTKQRRNCLHGWAVMSTYACAINFEGLDLAAAMTTKTKDEKGNTFRTSIAAYTEHQHDHISAIIQFLPNKLMTISKFKS